jgi:anti-sigma regulatory factor (Ser/Thr protein kinase)/DNA-binding Xre family transcriptional regulator
VSNQNSSFPAAADCGDAAIVILLGSIDVPGQSEHVRTARSFTALALGEDHADIDTVVLLVSEMVTNSIQHSGSHRDGGTITVALFAVPGGIRAEITDEGGATVPALQACSPDSALTAEKGRGLRLVNTLSTRWGHHRDEAGTVTWFELETPYNSTSGTSAGAAKTVAALPSAAGGRALPPWTIVLDGTRLRHLRRLRGLSQEKLADRAGISITTVTRLESQQCSPCRGRTLGRLAAALGEHPKAFVPD